MTEEKPAAKSADWSAALDQASKVLLDHLPKEAILARYQAAGGKEVLSGKFSNPESSAALAANAFGFFIDSPAGFSMPILNLAEGTAAEVLLEAELRFPWSGGYHPWLDVVVETPDGLIGIESKRYEPFRDVKSVEFSEAYSRPVWGDNMKSFEAMRDALASGTRRFRFLDAAQLVKHAFGLRTQAQKKGKLGFLVYLFAEPLAYPGGRPIPAVDKSEHQREVTAFCEAVSGAEVPFYSLSYADLLSRWKLSTNEAVRNHAIAVHQRFDI